MKNSIIIFALLLGINAKSQTIQNIYESTEIGIDVLNIFTQKKDSVDLNTTRGLEAINILMEFTGMGELNLTDPSGRSVKMVRLEDRIFIFLEGNSYLVKQSLVEQALKYMAQKEVENILALPDYSDYPDYDAKRLVEESEKIKNTMWVEYEYEKVGDEWIDDMLVLALKEEDHDTSRIIVTVYWTGEMRHGNIIYTELNFSRILDHIETIQDLKNNVEIVFYKNYFKVMIERVEIINMIYFGYTYSNSDNYKAKRKFHEGEELITRIRYARKSKGEIEVEIQKENENGDFVYLNKISRIVVEKGADDLRINLREFYLEPGVYKIIYRLFDWFGEEPVDKLEEDLLIVQALN